MLALWLLSTKFVQLRPLVVDRRCCKVQMSRFRWKEQPRNDWHDVICRATWKKKNVRTSCFCTPITVARFLGCRVWGFLISCGRRSFFFLRTCWPPFLCLLTLMRPAADDVTLCAILQSCHWLHRWRWPKMRGWWSVYIIECRTHRMQHWLFIRRGQTGCVSWQVHWMVATFWQTNPQTSPPIMKYAPGELPLTPDSSTISRCTHWPDESVADRIHLSTPAAELKIEWCQRQLCLTRNDKN